MAKVITVTSGKGGVGKTSISLNLSLALSSAGFKVCLFDADLGLANVNILTGLFPENGLEQVMDGDLTLNEIMIRDFHGIDIIPGSSGVEKMADLTLKESDTLIKAFLKLDAYDYFIFDTSAGISAQVLSFCMASHEMILVVTPEPTSLTDAYSLLKVLSENRQVPAVKVVVNQVKTRASALKTWSKLKGTVQRFLRIKISPLGIVAHDRNVPAAIISQVPFFILSPDSVATRCIRSISQKLALVPDEQADIPMELFWHQCFQFFNSRKKAESQTRASGRRRPGPATPGTPPARDYSLELAELKQGLSRIEAQVSRLMDDTAGIKDLMGQVTELKRIFKQKAFSSPGEKPVPDRTLHRQRPAPAEAADRPEDSDKGISPVAAPLPKPGKIYLDFEAWMKKRSV
ncbi:MinD/ParA family protein [Desulfospira joergensenii]|uniref:MinD/ParA family protein n=1 Tax=Desulfospira joergensenii TaxID=53329 RepID=UPI00041685BE|nr:MinD/ParA family protein [Desulfospira joergensenii]